MPEETQILIPEVISEDRAHAERSASQLKNLALCSGYIPSKGNKRTHWVTAQGLRGHAALETDDESLLDSDYEIEMKRLCEDYVSRQLPADKDLKEIKVDTILGRWGYIDRLIIRGTHGDLNDYKFVRKREPDDAEYNLQGFDYLVGAFEHFRELETITVHFIAPRFGTVTTATFSRLDLPRLKLDILSVIARARATDRDRAAVARFTPEYDTCRFCGRLAKCPAITALGLAVQERYTGTRLPLIPSDVHSSKATDPKVLGALKMLADILGPWVDSVDAHTASVAKYDGIIAEGYELAYRKGQRKVTNPVALITLATKFGVSVDEILLSAKVSIPGLEKLVQSKAPKGTKAAKRREFLNACRDADAFERLEDTPFLQKSTATPPAPSLE